MKKTSRTLLSLLLTLVLATGLATTALAADSTVTYTGGDEAFVFQPGSYYTDTDLFENLKQVMPGDVRTEVVTLKNEYNGCDYVNLWMGALLHDENNNPISPKVLSELTADQRRGALSELEYMHDFLDQLTLTVWKGPTTEENILYKGRPSSLEQGFERENVRLGSLSYGESITLNIQLAVDIEMGNEYADRIGEVDWVFVLEEHDHSSGPDDPTPPINPPYTPDQPDPPVTPPDVPVTPPDQPDVPAPDVPAPDVPDSPKTGDDTAIWPYILLFVIGLVGMVVTTVGKRKGKKE